MFEVDIKELVAYERLLKRQSKIIQRATAALLNNVAFGVREEIFKTLRSKLTIRDPRFMLRSIVVEKCRHSTPIHQQVAEVGSISRPRFSGWQEQEQGTQAKKTHTATIAARGGSKSKKVIKSVRLKPGAKFPESKNYIGDSPRQQTQIMLKTLAKMKYKRPFIITGHQSIPSGLYRFKGRKKGHWQQRPIQVMQLFKYKMKPRRLSWMDMSVKLYMSAMNLRIEWSKAMNHALKQR